MFRRAVRAVAAAGAAALALTLAASGPAVGASTGGSGGPLTDRLNESFTSAGYTSDYHIFASGLDWSQPVGLLVYTDGSGGYGLDNPNGTYLLDADGTNGLVQVARDHNLVLVTPEAPAPGCDGYDNCWYDSQAAGKAQWSSDLITHVKGLYDIDLDRVAVGGYSSGAQWTTRFFLPAHGEAHSVDVAVAIAYGGAPAVTPSFSAGYKADTVVSFDTGTADSAYSTSSWGALGGHEWYTDAGFQTDATWPSGVGHSRGGEFAGIIDRELTEHPPAGGGTGPAPEPEPTDPVVAYDTTVTATENDGVTFVVENVPDNADATYVRLTSPDRTTYLYTYERPTADVTFTTLGTGGDEWSYAVYDGSSTNQEPKASGTFTTWAPPEPEPVPGDLTGDGLVDFADLAALAADRPGDEELQLLVDNWTG